MPIPNNSFDIFSSLTGGLFVALIWVCKQLFPIFLEFIGKGRPSSERNFITSNTNKMQEAMLSINTQFAQYTETLSGHNQRIEHMEHTIESLLKERCCPVHGETVKVLDKMSDDIESLKEVRGDIAGINKTLQTLKDMGVFHSHNTK